MRFHNLLALPVTTNPRSFLNQMAFNASVIVGSMTVTTKIAKEGEGIAIESAREVQQIASTVGESAELLKSLGERSEQISEIANLINDIADQTNLLALNAAIEAARAGDQGRGFAVVADEVRKLAERTGRSTSEIAYMIKSIQDEVDRAISSMEDATRKVEIGVQFTNKAGTAFSSIATRVDDLNSMVQQIASAVEEMAVTSEEIIREIESIAQISRGTSSHSEQTSKVSVQLVELSKDLGGAVSGFTI